MYLTTAPVPGLVPPPAPDRFPLPLARVITRRFPTGRPFAGSGLRIIADLAAAYRVPFRAEKFAARRRTTFTDMVASLADELADRSDPIGLVVLAHGAADAETQWPACYLAGVLPGQPFAFAVADQGVTTPFLALRIAAEYVRTDAPRRAAVLILDQASLLRDPRADPDAPVPTEDRVVALLFDRDGTLGETSVSVTAGTAPNQALAVLRDRVTAAARAPGAVVVGGRLAGALPAEALPAAGTAAVVVAPPGLPCTGPWTALARGLDAWRAGGVRWVALLDHEPGLGVLGHCTVGLSAPPAQRTQGDAGADRQP